MSFRDAQVFTLAHELGHILTHQLHYGLNYRDQEDIDVQENNILTKEMTDDFRVQKNLMKDGTLPSFDIKSTKRLYHSQERLIQTYLKTVPY